MAIRTKQFQILSDSNVVWDFLVDTYDRSGGGLPAPFFEYAILSTWMDNSYQFLNRFWIDEDQVVGFVFNEAPVTDVFFKVRPGYEWLAAEMVDYAIQCMPNFNNEQRFMLFNGQEFLMEEAQKRGFTLQYDYEDLHFDFKNELAYELPKGFTFVHPSEIDSVKLAKCCWYGFNHADKGPFVDWETYTPSKEWNPHVAYKGVVSSRLSPTPHATPQYDVVIADQNGDYACYAGMWWVPENKLAYMEPLCTVPEYRKMGLAAAALTKHYRTMKSLGATHMTGGSDPFYSKIGYGKGLHWHCFKRKEEDSLGDS